MGQGEVTGTMASRACPACEVRVHPDRELCPACGADLETGERLTPAIAEPLGPWVRRAGPAVSDRLVAGLHHVRDRAVLTLLGVALVSTFVVGGLLVAERGPFAPAAVLPAVGFDPVRYPTEPTVLVVREAGSVPAAGGEEALLDGVPSTAWRVVRGPGGSVRLVLLLDEPAWVTRLVVRNGDQASADAYGSSGRVRRMIVVFDGRRRVGVDLLDVGLDSQVVALPHPELTTLIEIELVEAFDGASADDVAMSTLELVGWVAVGDDRVQALVRAGDRVDAPSLGPAG